MTSYSRVRVPSIGLWPAVRDQSSMELSTMMSCRHPKRMGSWISLHRGLLDKRCSIWVVFTLHTSSGALGVWGSSWFWERQTWVYTAAPGMCMCGLCVSWCQPTLSPLGRVFSGITCTELSPCYVSSLQLLFKIHFELHRKFHIEINTSSAQCVSIYSTHYNLSLVM